MSYDELVERNFTILASESFGDYQGDLVFAVRGSGGSGVIVAGYGSCSLCDAYQAACDDGAMALDELAVDLANSVHYGTAQELREYLLGEDAKLQWYAHEAGFAEAVENVLRAVEGG